MEEPIVPDESDCCNSGCNPCIFDVYEDQLRKYKYQQLKDVIVKPNCLSPTTYSVFKLIKIVDINYNTKLLTFQYFKRYKTNYTTKDDLALIYRPGQHFLLKGHFIDDQNNEFTRAYTPLPISNEKLLTFTILAKLYENGQMAQFLRMLKLNSETLWRGPYGDFQVDFTLEFILLIAQGTGIAPLFSVINQILNNTECETFLKLFCCFATEQDILLRDQLYDFRSYWNFTYEIFVSNSADVQCKYNEIIHSKSLEEKFISDYLKNKIGRNVQVLICGSEMFNACLSKIVLNCGFESNKIFTF